MLFSSIIAATLAALSPQWATQRTEVQTLDIGHTLDQLRQRWHIQGVAAVIVQHPNFTSDGAWSTETFTLGQRDRLGHPVTDDTLFEVASNSKLFTAIAAGLLVHNETLSPRLTWKSKVHEVIPEWQLMDDVATEEADLRDLLSHRSGMPRHEFMYESSWTSLDYIQRLRYLKASTGFRQEYQYSNPHYVTASYLSEAIFGQPFWDYVQNNMLNPLGMSSTTYNVTIATSSGRRADGFVRVGRNMTHCAESLRSMKWSEIKQDDDYKVDKSCIGEVACIGWPTSGEQVGQAGPGGVITCARDLAIWLKMLLLKGQEPESGRQVIPASIIDEVAKGRTVPSGAPTWPEVSAEVYGMGQMRYHYRGHEVIEHGGGDPGFMSQVSRIPDRGIGIAIMTNDDAYGTPYHMIAKYRIFDALLGLEPINWEARLVKSMIAVPPPRPKARPERPERPSDGFSNIAGTYNHGAYGRITLCAVPSTLPAFEAERLAQPAECKKTLAHQPVPAAKLVVPTFVAAVNKTWISHLIFEHNDGNMFNVTTSTTYPETNLTTFAVEPSYENVFAQFDADGFGMGGGFWGAGSGLGYGDIAGEGVKAGSEAYFDRVA